MINNKIKKDFGFGNIDPEQIKVELENISNEEHIDNNYRYIISMETYFNTIGLDVYDIIILPIKSKIHLGCEIDSVMSIQIIHSSGSKDPINVLKNNDNFIIGERCKLICSDKIEIITNKPLSDCSFWFSGTKIKKQENKEEIQNIQA